MVEDKEVIEEAVFAGGCFWCMEHPFDRLLGVHDVTVGYTGGTGANPTYEQVCSGKSGHLEVVRVRYNPEVISYEKLLKIFWRNIDPTTRNRQFCDIGSQYKTAIFFQTAEQQVAAEGSRERLLAEGRFDTVVTEVLPLGKFYPAEDYHQKFYKKNPDRYQQYSTHSGRMERLKELWGDSE